MGSRFTAFVLVNFDFEMFLDFVGEFHARSRKQLYSIVVERVMGGGNHHAGGEFLLPYQACDTRSADNSRGKDLDAVVGKTGRKL